MRSNGNGHSIFERIRDACEISFRVGMTTSKSTSLCRLARPSAYEPNKMTRSG